MHRSKSRTALDQVFRFVLRAQKFRCSRCNRVRWLRSDWVTLARDVRRAQRDPVARRVILQGWRRRLLVVLLVAAAAAVAGQLVGRWHEAMVAVEPTP
jgi:predicted RNase H-like nuclease